MSRDLDRVADLWYDSRLTQERFVVGVQKEMFHGHYLFGKGEVYELKPLPASDLVIYFFKVFDKCEPFTLSALWLVAELSRGIFRRFLKYIRLCVEDMVVGHQEVIDVANVREVITREVLLRDLDLELSGSLKGQEKALAASLLQLLSVSGELNQKEIAKELGVTPAFLGRLLMKLEAMGYVSRMRGIRKEILVSLKPC
jgi:hypothetical protein